MENGRGAQTAIIYDSPVTDTLAKISYQELHDILSRFAGILSSQEVKKEDRVILYMPMIPEAVKFQPVPEGASRILFIAR